MRFSFNSFQIKFREFFKKYFHSKHNFEKRQSINIHSVQLDRIVRVDLYFPPPPHWFFRKRYSCLFFNDGQDMKMMKTEQTLERLFKAKAIKPFVLAAIHAGDRMYEYGTADQPDYAGRGSKAGIYTAFIIKELLPLLQQRYGVDSKRHAIAGCSLGGLSAFDIAWNHSDIFSQVGIFSGSLWWRSAPFRIQAPDADRIAHDMVWSAKKQKALRFWLEAGTRDETNDRNNNGVIDAIDDTLDLISALKEKGYTDQDIRYVEVEGGEHNPQTWGEVLPDFLKWGFGH